MSKNSCFDVQNAFSTLDNKDQAFFLAVSRSGSSPKRSFYHFQGKCYLGYQKKYNFFFLIFSEMNWKWKKGGLDLGHCSPCLRRRNRHVSPGSLQKDAEGRSGWDKREWSPSIRKFLWKRSRNSGERESVRSKRDLRFWKRTESKSGRNPPSLSLRICLTWGPHNICGPPVMNGWYRVRIRCPVRNGLKLSQDV